MGRFSIIDTPLAGLKVIKRESIGDSRGHLARIFCVDALKSAGWEKPIVQINQTITKRRGSVRGMHFQNPPYSEMKLVSCLHGEIWDVAVDLRKNSPTFLHWHAEHLSLDNQHALLIPEGFAHGFQTLSDNCELLYLHTAPYMPGVEGGIKPNDPKLGISWPLDFVEMSTRDAGHPEVGDQFTGIEL